MQGRVPLEKQSKGKIKLTLKAHIIILTFTLIQLKCAKIFTNRHVNFNSKPKDVGMLKIKNV